MNTLTAIRSAIPQLTPPAPLRGEALPGARIIRPNELRELVPTTSPTAAPADTRPTNGSFSSLLSRMVSEVNAKQNAAAQSVAAMQTGQPVSLHQAMISMEEASVSFQLMAEVRNKLLESYQELMRMQV